MKVQRRKGGGARTSAAERAWGRGGVAFGVALWGRWGMGRALAEESVPCSDRAPRGLDPLGAF